MSCGSPVIVIFTAGEVGETEGDGVALRPHAAASATRMRTDPSLSALVTSGAGSTPEWHLATVTHRRQGPALLTERRTSHSRSTLVGRPPPADQFSMPTQHRLRLHQEAGPGRSRQPLAEAHSGSGDLQAASAHA
jgi:hypothetical protein